MFSLPAWLPLESHLWPSWWSVHKECDSAPRWTVQYPLYNSNYFNYWVFTAVENRNLRGKSSYIAVELHSFYISLHHSNPTFKHRNNYKNGQAHTSVFGYSNEQPKKKPSYSKKYNFTMSIHRSCYIRLAITFWVYDLIYNRGSLTTSKTCSAVLDHWHDQNNPE